MNAAVLSHYTPGKQLSQQSPVPPLNLVRNLFLEVWGHKCRNQYMELVPCRNLLLLGLNHLKGYIGSGETHFCLNPFSDPNDHYHSWPTRPNFGITGHLLPGLQCHSLLRVSSWWWVSKGRCCPLDHCFVCCRGCQKSAKVREKYSINTYRERLPGILNEPQKSYSQAGLARSKRLNSNTKKLF